MKLRTFVNSRFCIDAMRATYDTECPSGPLTARPNS